MKNKPNRRELLEAQDYFNLPSPALVEKDWHVVQALAALTQADIRPFRLVFGGGTSLSRAHRLIRRMSEDIDLKILLDEEGQPTRRALGQLREVLTQALLQAGFNFDPDNQNHRDSRNNRRYTIFRLPYEPLLQGAGVLRPEIQVEVAVWPLRHPSVEQPVASFVAEAFHQPPEVESLACVSVTQTAAEKFVALTRRVAAERDHPAEQRDKTLVRHLYDLHIIQAHYDPDEMLGLAHATMLHDAEMFRSQSAPYRENPLAETLRAIEALERDPHYAQSYAAFYQEMVYGDEKTDYATGLATLKALSRRLYKAT